MRPDIIERHGGGCCKMRRSRKGYCARLTSVATDGGRPESGDANQVQIRAPRRRACLSGYPSLGVSPRSGTASDVHIADDCSWYRVKSSVIRSAVQDSQMPAIKPLRFTKPHGAFTCLHGFCCSTLDSDTAALWYPLIQYNPLWNDTAH